MRVAADSTCEISRHIIVTVKRVALLQCGLARVRIVEAICSFTASRPIVRYPAGSVYWTGLSVWSSAPCF